MHGGERPNMPNGEQGTPPDVPEGMQPPEKPNGDFSQGERPNMPNGENPNGTPPELPNGEIPEGMTPPEHGGGMMGGNMMPSGKASTTFIITAGGNQFINVGPAKD